MMSKLFVKVSLSFLVVTIFLTVLIFVTSLQAAQYYYQTKLSTAMTDLCVVLGRVVSPLMDGGTVGVAETIERIHFEPGRRIAVLDTDGRIVADTQPNSGSLSEIGSRREFINALNGVVGTYTDSGSSGGGDILSATAPVWKGGDVVGVVMIRQPFKTGIASIPPILFLAVSVFVLFFSILGAVIISSHLTNPIQELSYAAKRVSEGDFTARVFLDRNDEIKYLADRFNFMTERIDLLFSQVLHQKDELLQIISALDEGLAVIDNGDRIVLFNDRFGAIAHEQPVVGRFYWEALRDLRISEMVAGTKKNSRNGREQVQIKNRVYNCNTIHIPSRDEIVIVLHDITEITDLERMKREFVTNVSHELRTPLTAVKGFVETMEETGLGESSRYLKIIKRNTDRMISIITDLLILSEFEEKDVKLHIEEIDVEEMVRGILTLFEKDLKNKGLTVDVVVENGPVVISADRFKLEQLFINIIQNAVTYTERGGIIVRVSRTDNTFEARIEDSGIGIAKDNIPRIFDRFYRVDKSRSRSLGGTGLGLSIVKYIALLHNGAIRVESTEGVGTTFIVTIPQQVRRQP